MERAPVTYVSEYFLDEFDLKRNQFRQMPEIIDYEEFISKELKSCERILVLLLNSILVTDINEKEIIKLCKQSLGSKKFKNCKEAVCFKAFKANRLVISRSTFSECTKEEGLVDANLLLQSTIKKNAIYFLADNHNNCTEASLKYGLASCGIGYDYKDFFSSASLSNYAAAPELEILKQLQHDANSMIIIDKYIFCDSPGKSPKIPNVINAVKAFMNEKLTIKFQLDILTQNQDNNELLRRKANELIEGLGGIDKISIHIYSPLKLKESDRFLLTNYCLINLGHPFDRTSLISSSLYVSQENKEKLISAYSIWREKLESAKQAVLSTPKQLGLIQCVFKTDDEIHRLFSLGDN